MAHWDGAGEFYYLRRGQQLCGAIWPGWMLPGGSGWQAQVYDPQRGDQYTLGPVCETAADALRQWEARLV